MANFVAYTFKIFGNLSYKYSELKFIETFVYQYQGLYA